MSDYIRSDDCEIPKHLCNMLINFDNRADEADVPHMVEYYRQCISAYYRGFSEYAEVSSISDHCVHELILAMFGYRLLSYGRMALLAPRS